MLNHPTKSKRWMKRARSVAKEAAEELLDEK
jgi:hypothetical protein